jgi:probable HAF family extracellular repeat protein
MSIHPGKLPLMCVGAVALVTVAACTSESPTDSIRHYTATSLGTLGGTYSQGTAVNNRGQVTGVSGIADNAAAHAFLYSGKGLADLGTLGGTDSAANDINDRGQITGASGSTGGGPSHAFLYSGGGMSDLGTLGGSLSSGQGINSQGQVTGWSLRYPTSVNALPAIIPQTTHAFLYFDGTMIKLDAPGGSSSAGYGINDSGQITGWVATATGASRAFLYSGGTMIDLGTLGGTISEGRGINNAGQVTGWSDLAGDRDRRAFLYANGKMTDLGTLGGSYSEGRGINASGQVVGSATTADSERLHAFLYSDGRMVDLNMLVVSGLGTATLTQGIDINDYGQIVANACDSFQHPASCTAYLLDPIAAPAMAMDAPKHP